MTRRPGVRVQVPGRVVVLALVLLAPSPIHAQDLSNGSSHFSYGVRGRSCWWDGRVDDVVDDPKECPCGPGVAYATVSLTDHRVTSFQMKVRRAGKPAPTHDKNGVDVGRLSGPRAAELLLELAARGGIDGEELIAAASVADSAVVWPRLIELARARGLGNDTRQAAVFWLGQAAEEEAARGLDSIVADPKGDRDLREHAVFALSQRPNDEAVPALIRIAHDNPDPAIRRKALFWLGQTGDERAVALFEDILRR